MNSTVISPCGQFCVCFNQRHIHDFKYSGTKRPPFGGASSINNASQSRAKPGKSLSDGPHALSQKGAEIELFWTVSWGGTHTNTHISQPRTFM